MIDLYFVGLMVIVLFILILYQYYKEFKNGLGSLLDFPKIMKLLIYLYIGVMVFQSFFYKTSSDIIQDIWAVTGYFVLFIIIAYVMDFIMPILKKKNLFGKVFK